MSRTLRVDTLARVEGEGALHLQMKEGRVTGVQLRIFEAPRFFEALLRGRHFSEVPDIVARICGICPVAYQMSALHAIESALAIPVDPAIRLLRRLFYCGEWIESHALHIFLLHAPDYLGYHDAFEMAREGHRELVEQALRLKKSGNAIVRLLGGREIHPVSPCVGGFTRLPRRDQMQRELRQELEWSLETALAAVRFVATLPFPDFQQNYDFVSLVHEDEYPLNEGRLASSHGGWTIDASAYDQHFVERHVAHSNALHSVRRWDGGSYLTGPMARFHLNFERLPEVARRAAEQAGLVPPVRNPFRGIVVRAVELVFACHEALRILDEYREPASAMAVPQLPDEAVTGHAITEAPRGSLYHCYEIGPDGLIRKARIVPPTAQNLRRIEEDLREYAPIAGEPLAWKCEQAIRNYDPCISCATHALRVEVERC